MTKCLLKALKAVDLERHVGLFRSLGYNSAASLKRFRTEHFEQLNLNERELLRLISLLDLLKDTNIDGKLGSQYFHSTKINKPVVEVKSAPIRASWSDETNQHRAVTIPTARPLYENSSTRRSFSALSTTRRAPSVSMSTGKSNNYQERIYSSQRSSTVTNRSPRIVPSKIYSNQRVLGPKSFLHRPAIQHVKVKSYNYGIPTFRKARGGFGNRFNHQRESHGHYSSSVFANSSSHPTHDGLSYGKPAEIYVYARKRPLLSTEQNFQDSISVLDGKRILIAENKANLDCSPLLKKTEFQFDQVFGADVSNKQVFEQTVFPFLSLNHRPNLTYICFGQTGSGKSHTIFGSKTTDGLLVYCTQLLLYQTDFQTALICSFYEIYNNQVYDLNNVGKRLFVREDGNHHVNVIGVKEIILKSLDDLRAVIDDGLSRRHHGKSAFNSNSSRSHAVFQLTLKNNQKSAENFRLIFIDLAGSERATDAQNNQRQTRREGAQINWSLLALKECIRSMDMTHSHAPFRQSKLTHILRDSLVGSKTRTCLLANVSPASDCCQCSLNTLQYASRIRDISMRHRHRSMPVATMPMTLLDENLKEPVAMPEKSQGNFKPATSSTPVHRLVSSAEVQMLKSNQFQDVDARLTKTIDIDWQVVDDDDDDLAIAGSGENLLGKSHGLSSNHKKSSKKSVENPNQYETRYQQATKLIQDVHQSPSNYFPMPQENVRKVQPPKRSYNRLRLMLDDGNERRVKKNLTTIHRHSSESSGDHIVSARLVPVVPSESSDEKPSEDVLGENHRLDSNKILNSDQQYQRSLLKNRLMNEHFLSIHGTSTEFDMADDLNRNLYLNESGNEDEQSEFLTNRDDLLTIISNRLSTNHRRSSSLIKSNPVRSQSHKETNSSSTRTHSAHRRPKLSASNGSTVTKTSKSNSTSKYSDDHQRTVNSQSNRFSHVQQTQNLNSKSHRKQVSAKSSTSNVPTNSTYQRQTETKRTDPMTNFHSNDSDRNSFTPISSPMMVSMPSPTMMPNSLTQVPLDHMKTFYDLAHHQQQTSPTPSPNINNSWAKSMAFTSPSKDFGLRVSEQLNALRSLLETRLNECDDLKRSLNESRNVQQSPKKAEREVHVAAGQKILKKTDSNGNSYGFDYRQNDDDDQEVARSFDQSNRKHQSRHIEPFHSSSSLSTNGHDDPAHPFETIVQPSLSSFSNELNQARVISTTSSPSTSTITSNLAAKIENQDFRSNQDNGNDHQASTVNAGASSGTSLPTSDSERQVETFPFLRTFSFEPNSTPPDGQSPINFPPFSSLDFGTAHREYQDQCFDNGKGSSIVAGPSFDALMNSLKTMREKSFDFAVRPTDEQMISVAE